MPNQDLVNIFYEVADILEIKKIPWKPQAYRKAARSLQSISKDIKEIYNRLGLKLPKPKKRKN